MNKKYRHTVRATKVFWWNLRYRAITRHNFDPAVHLPAIGWAVLAFVFFMSIALTGFNHKSLADTSGMYAASDVIGGFNAGSDYNGSPANQYGLWEPTGVSIDSVHHVLWVADGGNSGENYRIMAYPLDSNNQVTSMAATYVLGEPDFTTAPTYNFAASQSSVNPLDITFDSVNDRLFLADTFDSRVIVYDFSSGITDGMNASYVLGQSDFTTTTANGGTMSTMSYPYSVAYDSAHQRLFVADSIYNSQGRILEFDLSGGITTGMAASHVLPGSSYVSSSWGTGDLTYDSADQYLFMSDGHSSQVLIYDLSGGIADNMANAYTLSVNMPSYMTYDQTHHLLFVDGGGTGQQSAYRVSVFDLSGGITNGMTPVHTLGAVGEDNFSEKVTTQNSLGEGGLAYDSVSGQLFAADDNSNRVMIFNLSGGISDNMNASAELGQTDLAGSPTFGGIGYPNDFNGFANQDNLDPTGSAIDTVHHRFFLADPEAGRVMVYGLDSNNNLTNKRAIAVLGEPDFTTFASWSSAGGTPLTASSLIQPTAVTYDGSRNLLFVGDAYSDRIVVYDLTNGLTTNMDASFVLGQTSLIGTSSASCPAVSQSTFCPNSYMDMALDPTTNYLYVDDGNNNRVLVFDTTNLSDGMSASYELGQAAGPTEFTSSNSATTQSGFSNVRDSGLAVDPNTHELFVGDTTRVLVFSTASLSDGMDASYELGEPDFNSTSWSGNVDNQSFSEAGLTYDPNNQRLFVSDTDADRIMSFDLQNGISNGMPASAVIGAPDFSTNDYESSPPSKYNLGRADTSETYDPTTNRLYVSAEDWGRVLIYNVANLAPLAQTTYQVGDSIAQALGNQYQGTPTYSLDSGSLPPGVTLDPSSGQLAGTLTTPGTYAFRARIVDNNGNIGSFSDLHDYSITVASANGGGGGTTGGNNGGGGTNNNGGGNSGNTNTGGDTTSSGSGNGTTGGSVSKPAASSPSVIPTVVTTPDGLVVDINLQNGQNIPSSGYTVTFTPESNKDNVSLRQVKAVIGGQVVDTLYPDQTGTARWDWQPATSGPVVVTFLITDSLGRQTSQTFNLTVAAPQVDMVQRSSGAVVMAKGGASGGILDGLTRFVGSLPNAVQRGFPYFLLILLVIDAAILFRRALRELIESRAQKKLFEQAKNVNLLKTTFVQLASHYLRTPITVMKSGLELLASDATSAALSSHMLESANEIGSSIEPLLESATANNSDPLTMFVGSNAPDKFMMLKPVVFAPILLIGVTCLLFDYLVKRANTFSLSTDALIEQAILFSIGVLLLYSVYRYLLLKRRDNQELRGILQSVDVLSESRDKLIADAAEILEDKVGRFNGLVEQVTNPTYKKLLKGGSDRLGELVRKFQVAMIMRGPRSEAIVSNVSAAELIGPVQIKLKDELARNEMTLKVTGDGMVPVKETELIRYVLETLVTNAISYKRSPGEITINVNRGAITVTDRGAGIPENKLPLLFQPFFKAEGAEEFSHEGMGFSLYLDKLIMAYVGGNITVSSTQGEGTTVIVTLPK